MTVNRLKNLNLNHLAQAGLFLLVYFFLFSFLKPGLIFSDTLTTGGDTASHYFSAVYLKDHILPQGRIMGWQPGNYAGFPLFQFYFPLPFFIMVLLSLAIPLTVSFKIVSLAGVFSLPLAVYYILRKTGFKKPVPELGMVFILSFLFMESNSMWGGNITSTLAGEFAYGIGLSLALVYLGGFFQGIKTGNKVVTNALLLALVGLSHGYALLFCVAGVSFFLITTKSWLFRLVYILKVNLLAFFFMAFWILPLLALLPYSTPYNFVWIIDDLGKVIPAILWPFVGSGLAGAVISLLRFKRAAWIFETRTLFMFYLVMVALLFYLTGSKIGVVDIRFIPFGQVFVLLLGAIGAASLLVNVRLKHLAILALAFVALVWIAHYEEKISSWMYWNYTGYENKPLWPAFKDLNDHLNGTFADPRIVYEHAMETSDVGSLRAFENLPMFSGRATLEGLYIQSSLSSPFVFYIQSEVSKIHSSPLHNYNYSRFDLTRALPHLKLFNVNQYVTVTDETRRAALKIPGLELEKRFPPFAVFHIKNNLNQYVVQPRFAPVLALSSNPKYDAFEWFRWADVEVPLVFASKVTDKERRLFHEILDPGNMADRIQSLPRLPLPSSRNIKETVRNNEIIIQGAIPGRPLWIKASFHPNWRVEGADRIWRASPAFMLIFPNEPLVRLYFGRAWYEYLGLSLTGLGVALAIYMLILTRASGTKSDFSTFLDRPLAPLIRLVSPRAELFLGGIMILAVGIVLFLIFAVHHQDPTVFYNRGLKLYKLDRFQQAQEVFKKAAEKFPLSPIIDQTLHHLALSYFKQELFEQAVSAWNRFPEEYPESRLLAEALYHMGLSYQRMNRLDEARELFNRLQNDFPETRWSEFAGQRLSEIYGPGGLYQKAHTLFDQNRFTDAFKIFRQVYQDSGQTELGQQAAYFAAVSLFKAENWQQSVYYFRSLLDDFPDGSYSAEAFYHLGLIYQRLGENEKALKHHRRVIDEFSGTRWADYSRKALAELNLKNQP